MKRKRFLSLVMAAALVFVSAAALPDSAFGEVSTASVSAEAETGKCGENVSWSLKDGVLTISGTGNMYDYEWGESPFYFEMDIKSVVIKFGVKSIGKNAFYLCEKFTSIIIPNSITTIGDGAFNDCRSLTSVTLPSSVKRIGASAFFNCASLVSITMPDGLISIGKEAFGSCSSLKKITIPSSVTLIEDYSVGYSFNWLDYSKIDDFVLYGYKGTAVEKYAKDHGIMFIDANLVTRISGSGRFETAVAISKAGFPDGAKTVVLANGRKFYDALAGVTLANAYDAPILLTEANALPAETLAEIKRLKATKVIILGGSGSVGQGVKDTLDKNGLNYDIIKGSSRFATAVRIAEETQKITKKDPTEIFFVSSEKAADALSVSAVAALKNAPIIYLPKSGNIDADTAAYLKTMNGKVKNAYVIGGSGVIGADVMAAAGKALGLTVDKTIVRVKGSDKYGTCVEVNNKFASVLTGKSICVATGEDFPDALAGGVFAAKNNAPLFLVNGKVKALALSDAQKSYLKTKSPQKLYVFS